MSLVTWRRASPAVPTGFRLIEREDVGTGGWRTSDGLQRTGAGLLEHAAQATERDVEPGLDGPEWDPQRAADGVKRHVVEKTEHHDDAVVFVQTTDRIPDLPRRVRQRPAGFGPQLLRPPDGDEAPATARAARTCPAPAQAT